MNDSTRSQVHHGLKWVTLSLVFARGTQFLTTVVLARLLLPEMFGLITMANAVIIAIGAIREIGFGQAYIQRQEADAEEGRLAANTTFFLLLGIHALLFVAALLLSPWTASFFERAQELEAVLQVILLAFLLDGVAGTPGFVLQKNLQFGKLSLAEIIATFSNALIAIPMAFLGFGAWSLVCGQLGSRLVLCAALLKLSGWRPRLEFSPRIARQLFAYGKFLWGFSAVSAVSRVLDRLTLGHLLGAATVGVYGLAFDLCSMPANQLAILVNRIAFPAFSRKQQDKAALRRGFLKALSHVAVVTLPLALGLAMVAHDFVLTVYGSQWVAAVPIIGVLACRGMILAVSSVAGPVLQAIGKPQVLLYTSVVHSVVLFTLLLLFGRYGLVAVAYAVLVPQILSALIAFVLIVRYLNLGVSELLAPLVRSTASALVMYILVRVFQHQLLDGLTSSTLVGLLSSVLVGVVVYLAGTLLWNRALLVEFSETIKEALLAKSRIA